jgi:hypothetical protein
MGNGLPQYEVTAPNSEYNNKTFGVKFDAGHAYLSERTVNTQYLGRDVHQTAEAFLREYPEYTVIALTPQAQEVLENWREKTGEHPAPKSNVVLKVPRTKKNAVTAKEGIFKTEG